MFRPKLWWGQFLIKAWIFFKLFFFFFYILKLQWLWNITLVTVTSVGVTDISPSLALVARGQVTQLMHQKLCGTCSGHRLSAGLKNDLNGERAFYSKPSVSVKDLIFYPIMVMIVLSDGVTLSPYRRNNRWAITDEQMILCCNVIKPGCWSVSALLATRYGIVMFGLIMTAMELVRLNNVTQFNAKCPLKLF